jgi:hypothetical protein
MTSATTGVPSQIDRKLKALDSFKDWSNYLLVTTVAALGWVSTEVQFDSSGWRVPIIGLLTVSIVLAMLTLGLVPLVAEAISDDGRSFYDTPGSYRPFWMYKRVRRSIRLKWVCFPQHGCFLIAIILYGIAASTGNMSKVSSPQAAVVVNPR